MARPEDFDPPPNLDPAKIQIDHDIFHALDHTIGSKYCRSLNGNWKRAIKLHWEYEWDFGPWNDRTRPFRIVFGCWFNKHRYSTQWKFGEDRKAVFHNRTCWWCGKKDPDLIDQERIA